jgi:AcrR family transcriptional regulator
LKEKEQKILDASLKLFTTRGFHGTSTAEIAKTAGVATGTLFHYFKSKEELINRLYFYTKDSMLKEFSENCDYNKPFKENLKSLWLNLVNFGINDAHKFQFIITFHCSPYITSLTREQVENKLEGVLEVYKMGFKEQEIKEIYFELAMDYFWGSVVSTVDHFGKYPEKFNERNLDLAFELFWDGISR